MGRDEFVTEFLERGLPGFYLAVVREGEVAAGEPIVELQRDPRGFGVTEVARLFAGTATTSRACDARLTSTCFRMRGATTSGSGWTLERREPLDARRVRASGGSGEQAPCAG